MVAKGIAGIRSRAVGFPSCWDLATWWLGGRLFVAEFPEFSFSILTVQHLEQQVERVSRMLRILRFST